MSGENAASVPEDTHQTPIREIRHKELVDVRSCRSQTSRFFQWTPWLPLSLSLWEYRRSPS